MEENNKKNKRKSAIEKIEKQNQKIERMVSRNFMDNTIANLSNTLFDFSNVLQKNYMPSILENVDALMSEINIINEIIPRNYINNVIKNISIQSKMISKVYLDNVIELNKIYENIMFEEYTTKIFKNLANSISNMYYTETIKDCVKILINSKININNLITDEEINSDLIENIEGFNEKDKEKTEEVVKEIANIANNEEKNIEQKINEKWSEIKAKHPLITSAIVYIIGVIIGMRIESFFTQDSNQYYIKNYVTTNINIVECEEKIEFINNAKYVAAENLNVRQGPGKEFDVVASLKYGDVIKVEDKTKYWTKVEYKDVENDVNIKGWVYTRYITGFNPELLEMDVNEEK